MVRFTYRSFLTAAHQDGSPNTSEQPPSNTAAPPVIQLTRRPNPRHSHHPSHHPQGHRHHPNNHLPFRPQLLHCLRGTPQLCPSYQQDHHAPSSNPQRHRLHTRRPNPSARITAHLRSHPISSHPESPSKPHSSKWPLSTQYRRCNLSTNPTTNPTLHEHHPPRSHKPVSQPPLRPTLLPLAPGRQNPLRLPGIEPNPRRARYQPHRLRPRPRTRPQAQRGRRAQGERRTREAGAGRSREESKGGDGAAETGEGEAEREGAG